MNDWLLELVAAVGLVAVVVLTVFTAINAQYW